jgi:hypothetical protein
MLNKLALLILRGIRYLLFGTNQTTSPRTGTTNYKHYRSLAHRYKVQVAKIGALHILITPTIHGL